jgi:hypothetical protein
MVAVSTDFRAVAQEPPKHRHAGDAPPLPTTARKLGKSEVLALMDGKKFAYTSFDEYLIYRGTLTFDFDKGEAVGDFTAEQPPPAITGESEVRISLDGDNLCVRHEGTKECGGVYADPDGIYRVDDATGKVAQIYQKQ